MKHLLPLLIALVIGNPLFAQIGSTHFENSKYKKMFVNETSTSRNLLGGFIGSTNDGFLIYEQIFKAGFVVNKFLLTIDYYDFNHVKKHTFQPFLTYGKEDLKLVSTFISENKIVLIASCYNPKDNANYLLGCHMDVKGKLLKEWTHLDTIYEKQKITPFYFGVILSTDKQNFVVDHRKAKIEGQPVEISYKFFDLDFNREKAVDLKPNIKVENFNTFQNLLDNDGNLFIFYDATEEFNKRLKSNSNIENPRAYYIEKEENTCNELVIADKDKFYTGFHANLSKEGRLFLGAFVFDNLNGNLKGYLRQEIDRENFELVNPQMLTMENANLERSAGRLLNLNPGFKDLQFSNVKYLEDDDGNSWVIAEQQMVHTFSSTVTSGNVQRSVVRQDNYCKSLFVIRLNIEQEPIWFKTIPKRQFQEYDFRVNFTSYAATLKNHNLYLVFNDHRSNLNPNEKEDKSHMLVHWDLIKVNITRVEPNPKSTIASQALFSPDIKRFWLMLDFAHTLKNGDLLVVAERNEKYRPGTLRIESKMK